MDISRDGTVGFLSIRHIFSICNRPCPVFVDFVDNNCNKYRQTSRLVAGAISIVTGTIYNVKSLVAFWWSNTVKSLCLVTSTLSYTKIFLTLSHNQIQPQENISQAQSTQATPLNMARYRKAASSALWIQVTIVVCYLPYFVAVFLTPHGELPFPNYLARQFGITISFLYSSLNPLLYCWKIKDEQWKKHSDRFIVRLFNFSIFRAEYEVIIR